METRNYLLPLYNSELNEKKMFKDICMMSAIEQLITVNKQM